MSTTTSMSHESLTNLLPSASRHGGERGDFAGVHRDEKLVCMRPTHAARLWI